MDTSSHPVFLALCKITTKGSQSFSPIPRTLKRRICIHDEDKALTLEIKTRTVRILPALKRKSFFFLCCPVKPGQAYSHGRAIISSKLYLFVLAIPSNLKSACVAVNEVLTLPTSFMIVDNVSIFLL